MQPQQHGCSPVRHPWTQQLTLQARVAANLDAQVAEVAKKLSGLEADICELKSMAAAVCKPFSKAEKVSVLSAGSSYSGLLVLKGSQ